MLEVKDHEWVLEAGDPPPVDPESRAGIACATCGTCSFPDTRDEIEAILAKHGTCEELYVATLEKSGEIVRRGRVKRVH